MPECIFEVFFNRPDIFIFFLCGIKNGFVQAKKSFDTHSIIYPDNGLQKRLKKCRVAPVKYLDTFINISRIYYKKPFIEPVNCQCNIYARNVRTLLSVTARNK